MGLAGGCLAALGGVWLSGRKTGGQKGGEAQLWMWLAAVVVAAWVISRNKGKDLIEDWNFGREEKATYEGGCMLIIGALVLTWSLLSAEEPHSPAEEAFPAGEREPLLPSVHRILSSGYIPEKKATACPLCLAAFTLHDCKTLPCGHQYHSQCLSTWQRHSSVCLLCHRLQPNRSKVTL